MVNKPDLPSSVDKAEDLRVLSALLKCAGLSSSPEVAERVLPFWVAARGRARNVETSVGASVVPAHAAWPRS